MLRRCSLPVREGGCCAHFGEEATLNGAEGLAQERGVIERQDRAQAGLCVKNRTLLLHLVGPSVMNCQGYCALIVSVWCGDHGLQEPDQSRVSMCSQASWDRSHHGVIITMFPLARQSLPLRPDFLGQVLAQGGRYLGSLASFSKFLDPQRQK